MSSGLSVTQGAVRVLVRDRAFLHRLQGHAGGCPHCLDEAHGTRGCAAFEAMVEQQLLELAAERVLGQARELELAAERVLGQAREEMKAKRRKP